MHKINIKIYSLAGILLLIALGSFSIASAQGSGGVKGRVRTMRGDGISGVEITARRDGNDVRNTTSNSKGEFTLSGLEPGTYNFVFDAAGYNSGIRYNIEIRPNKTTDLGDRLILVVDKGTLVIVQGSVFFKNGRSVTGAKVEIEKIKPDGSTKSLPSLLTNVRGEFIFRQPEGAARYRLTAKYKGASATKEIEVDSAAVYRLAISLDVSQDEK